MTKAKPIQELLNFSLLNIDKPSGPTSFQISQYFKDSFKLKKASHLGTLDPQVSGVLPIALGRACKLSDFFMHKDKEYVGIMRLHEDVEEKVLQEELKKFIGKIKQLPPVRSSVKRAFREREIKEFKILEKNDKDVLFYSKVQAGTYIRKLIHDLGEKIGGAHMLELRRTKAGIFSEEDSNFINLYDFDKILDEFKSGNEKPLRKVLIPAEEAIKKVLPFIEVDSKLVKDLLIGKPLMKSDVSLLPEEETFAIFQKDKFICIMKKSQEGDIIARSLFVFN